MKWSDLMPGDKIRVSKEAKRAFPNRWLSNWWYNEVLEVTDVLHDDLNLRISVKAIIGCTESFHLTPDGKYNCIDFFELVELNGD